MVEWSRWWMVCCHQTGWKAAVWRFAGDCLTQPPGEGEQGWSPEEAACLDAPEVLHAKRAGRLVRPGQGCSPGWLWWWFMKVAVEGGGRLFGLLSGPWSSSFRSAFCLRTSSPTVESSSPTVLRSFATIQLPFQRVDALVWLPCKRNTVH